MSRKRRSLNSVLTRSSITEELRLRSDVVQELTFLLGSAIATEHANFSIVIDRARGFPSQVSPLAKYLRVVQLGEEAHRPHDELIRRVLLWGRFGPLKDDKAMAFDSDADTGKIVALNTLELLADCEMYCHSPVLGWELGQLRLCSSDEGWHEPITRDFLSQTWYTDKGRYQIKLKRI